MFNSRLAIHYGVAGPHLRGVTRVTLGPETGRGGMLTHASILLLTSDGAHSGNHLRSRLEIVIEIDLVAPPSGGR